MGILTVRNLDPVVQAKLRERAARNGRSMEAEARAVLAAAVAQDTEPTDLAASIRRHFSGADVTLELPDRSAAGQREIELPQ
ncbi:plasmid stabilization protein [Salinibacterium sp. ZJ450]|uniref:FitA-like ribbon-helix-helix domain-containing protein n=1 Tax=Salinibacterium sp. ZJ450 TaxID=2708338 RepID=UPI00141F7879|nr:plasmid stabilization protein [Salinibacterium sp. ZJ450]